MVPRQPWRGREERRDLATTWVTLVVGAGACVQDGHEDEAVVMT